MGQNYMGQVRTSSDPTDLLTDGGKEAVEKGQPSNLVERPPICCVALNHFPCCCSMTLYITVLERWPVLLRSHDLRILMKPSMKSSSGWVSRRH